MIEQIGLDNVIGGFILFLVIIGYQLDKFSKHSLKHIDMLQDRIDKLEEKVGIQEEFDMDPIGFARSEDSEQNNSR
jgi:hypothetical protein